MLMTLSLHFSHLDLNVVQTQLQLDLNAVAQWISSSRLCLNVVKSNGMLSGKALTVSIGSTVLNQAKSLQHLGILIDSRLLWSLLITSVVSRVRSRISSMLHFGTLPLTVLFLSTCILVRLITLLPRNSGAPLLLNKLPCVP